MVLYQRKSSKLPVLKEVERKTKRKVTFEFFWKRLCQKNPVERTKRLKLFNALWVNWKLQQRTRVKGTPP